ncbi:hypothetical protein C7974DRAFT_431535 [Boeremia exigua]|uniref:uncharacterized protein n=1 Tax=Boeremia exigua TaxID=749465 RepID=UPI001E8E1E22|nr:uncharacterized protein C7974DRAFT_431535 [Boeremia exigua]KAH6638796.1 hypothetical protein C7974DRAFT_431535 [Boeremia exigua]
MLQRTLLRAPHRRPQHHLLRRFATHPTPPTPASRLDRLNRRLPKFLHKHTAALATAPLSHITAFLLLHELTAIIPLIGLATTFHYTHWLPSWFAEGAWVLAGVERFGAYFQRKGWVRSADVAAAEEGVELRRRDRAWHLGEGGARVLVEVATAYAVTKVLLPVRIVVSVWGTPGFARWAVVPVVRRFKTLFGRGAKPEVARGGGTGAVGGGAVPRKAAEEKPTNIEMCFGDQTRYTTRTRIQNGVRLQEELVVPRHRGSLRRRYGASYYPSRYYARPPGGHYSGGAMRYPARYPANVGYPRAMGATAMGYPKPRHNYIYNPRYGQRGVLTYAGQQANGAYPSGVAGAMMPSYGYGYNYGAGGIGYAAAQPVYHPYASAYNSYQNYSYPNYSYPSHAAYAALGGYHTASLHGSMYSLANFYSPYQRSYYATVPSCGYTAHVYPPGPTTFHVANSHAAAAAPPGPVRTCAHTTREDVQMENRRIATERGAYSARRIKPADARDDDPFWCRERNGEWHLRTYYQIENECYPGQWLMDAEMGFLVFHRG